LIHICVTLTVYGYWNLVLFEFAHDFNFLLKILLIRR